MDEPTPAKDDYPNVKDAWVLFNVLFALVPWAAVGFGALAKGKGNLLELGAAIILLLLFLATPLISLSGIALAVGGIAWDRRRGARVILSIVILVHLAAGAFYIYLHSAHGKSQRSRIWGNAPRASHAAQKTTAYPRIHTGSDPFTLSDSFLDAVRRGDLQGMQFLTTDDVRRKLAKDVGYASEVIASAAETKSRPVLLFLLENALPTTLDPAVVQAGVDATEDAELRELIRARAAK